MTRAVVCCAYGIDHTHVLTQTERYLDVHRDAVGVERPWSIRVDVCCPSSFEDEASIAWDAELWFAELTLRCTLSRTLREWVLIHELYELKYHRTADVYFELVKWALAGDELGTYLIRHYQKARNQEIEVETGHYLSTRRPGHVTTREKEEPLLRLPGGIFMKNECESEVGQEEKNGECIV